MRHQRQVESHLEQLTSQYENKDSETQTIVNLQQAIRENESPKNLESNKEDHDYFDPSGKVCWGDSINAGFLTQSHSKREQGAK